MRILMRKSIELIYVKRQRLQRSLAFLFQQPVGFMETNMQSAAICDEINK